MKLATDKHKINYFNFGFHFEKKVIGPMLCAESECPKKRKSYIFTERGEKRRREAFSCKRLTKIGVISIKLRKMSISGKELKVMD